MAKGPQSTELIVHLQDLAMKILDIASSSRNVKLRSVAGSVIASPARNPAVRTHFDS